jgi:transcriptional regulator with XRE-family HTH domain
MQVDHADIRCMKIGRELKNGREAAGITQGELAEKAQLHRTYISQLEHDLKMPSLDVFIRLCRAMKISPATMITRIEKSN